PYDLFSDQLGEFLGQPGMEDACEQYLSRPRKPGTYTCMQDGSIWQQLLGPDDKPFFPKTREEADEQSELRLGLIISLDWFNPNSSTNAPAHSTGAFTVQVANLEPSMRSRVWNLNLGGVLPGPKEPDTEQLAHYDREHVEDFMRLWQDGTEVITPLYPGGRRVRCAVVAIVCDHPALCKICAFGDHAHAKFPCTKCQIHRDELSFPAPVPFPPRCGEQHKRRCARYYTLDDPKQREEYSRRYGVRWSEFCRMPYFNPVDMAIIDPMHALLLGIQAYTFLGLSRTLWFKVWISGGKTFPGHNGKRYILRGKTENVRRELEEVHETLDTFEMPPWFGKLPKNVGYPAGGNLTSDEWRTLDILYGPAAVS
ncbi:hypothetical protein CALVIDRAFT_471468, partial [Calocera viscosa TUFC12733]